MRSTRAAVLVVILVFGLVPNAAAGISGGDEPGFNRERIVRVVKKFLRIFGVVSHSDQVIGPRP